MEKNKRKVRALPPRDIAGFCLQIAMLLEAGVPLYDGVQIMMGEASDPAEQAILRRMVEGLEERLPFSRVLEQSGLFPPYVSSMAEVGESTGTLDTVMKDLSGYYSREAEIKESLKNAMVYPFLMLIISCLVLYVLAIKVMPVFETVFLQLGIEMNPLTRTALDWVGWISGAGVLLAVIVLLVAGGIRLLRRFGVHMEVPGWLQHFLDQQNLSQLIGIRRLTGASALALKSGMDIAEGMEMACGLTGNGIIAQKAVDCCNQLHAGEALGDVIQSTELFGSLHRQMIRVGIKAGRLESILEKVGADYDDMIDSRLERFLGRLEPALIGALSVVTGGMLLLVMLPLMSVITSIG